MSAPDDVIWAEIWGDGKRFNSVSSYCDDSNVANGDDAKDITSIVIILFQ